MGDTDMVEADRESGGGRNMAGEIKRRKIVLELEGLPYDPVERINPDGSVVMLPPQDAEDEFARKVAYMRAQEEKKKAAEEGKERGNDFAWKETVDMIRGAAGHARQLSLLLDLMGNRNLVLCQSEQKHLPLNSSSIVAKSEATARSQAAFATTAMRLQSEVKLDTVFLQGLSEVREFWNILPLKRSPLSVHASPGPVGALSISLGLQSSGTSKSKDEDCDAIIFRKADGTLTARMGKDFMARRLEVVVDPEYVPVASDGVSPGLDVVVPAGSGETAKERDRYLFNCLRSVLDNELFKIMAKEAKEIGRGIGIHAGKHLLAAGPVMVRMHARKLVNEEDEVGAEVSTGGLEGKQQQGGAAMERAGGGTGVLDIVARQLLRCEHRIKQRYKPGTGGQVPKPPHFQAPLGSTGILPALEQIARHVHFRSEVSAALEAAIPAGCVSRTAMNVSMHQHRSEAGTFSRFTVTASAGDAPESPSVVIDVSLRGTQCTVATTPSVLVTRSSGQSVRKERAEGVKLHVQATLSVLLMRAFEEEASSLGYSCRLTHAPKGRSDFCTVLTAIKGSSCVGFIFSTGAGVGKEIRVLEGKDALDLVEGSAGISGGAAVADCVGPGRPWAKLRGRTWRDKLRRALAGTTRK